MIRHYVYYMIVNDEKLEKKSDTQKQENFVEEHSVLFKSGIEENERIENAHKKYAQSLLHYAYTRVHNKGLSEDLVQETFLRTWKYVSKGGEIGIMKAFLYHVLSSLIIDEYRKQKHSTYSLESLTEGGFDVPTEEHKHKGESIDIKKAKNYIDKLPERYKSVVYMRLVLSMTLEEISKKLNRTKNNVTVQFHRGLKRIKDLHDEQRDSRKT